MGRLGVESVQPEKADVVARLAVLGQVGHDLADHAGELESVLTAKPTAHWLALLEAAGGPCGPINNMAQVMEDPQIAARNMVVTCLDAVAGNVPMPGNPIKISGVPDPATRAPAPALDGDREKILSEL